MGTKRTPINKPSRRISADAIAAWRRGECSGVHDALGLAPFEYSPVPRRFGAYGLPDVMNKESSTIIDQRWPLIKALQDELRAIAGEPGVED